MGALGWLRCSKRLERLRETEGISADEIHIELKRMRAGILSGVRSLISTSFVRVLGSAAGLPADIGGADCCCTCCIAAWYAVAAADILGVVGSCSGTPSGAVNSAIADCRF